MLKHALCAALFFCAVAFSAEFKPVKVGDTLPTLWLQMKTARHIR